MTENCSNTKLNLNRSAELSARLINFSLDTYMKQKVVSYSIFFKYHDSEMSLFFRFRIIKFKKNIFILNIRRYIVVMLYLLF